MLSDSTILEILDALEELARHIIDVETRFEKTSELVESITRSLRRQVIDGLISEQDSCELQYIADRWTKLYETLLGWCLNTQSVNEEIFVYLLDLFELKQITKEFFLRVVLELCQNTHQAN